MTSPISGCEGSTPAIEYVELLMFVCGGFTTCCTSCCGVVTVRLKLRAWAGRHFRAAGESRKPPRPPPPPPPPSVPPPWFAPPPWPGVIPCDWKTFWKQARILSCSAAENWKFTRPVTVRRCPPVFSLATIFGTVPVWCTAERTRPDDTAATPAIDAI